MKDKWLKQIEDAHKRLLKAFDLAPDDVKILGTWTKKEIMAHIAGWYEEFDREAGAVTKILKKRSVAKRKNMTQSKILQEIKDRDKVFILKTGRVEIYEITAPKPLFEM